MVTMLGYMEPASNRLGFMVHGFEFGLRLLGLELVKVLDLDRFVEVSARMDSE